MQEKVITDIYLERKEGETRKLRLDPETAKLISFTKSKSGEIKSAPGRTFNTKEEALAEIRSKEKIKKTLEKQIDVFDFPHGAGLLFEPSLKRLGVYEDGEVR